MKPTLQPLHPVQLREKLVDHAVCHARAVVAPPGRQGVKLIEEQDARLGGLSPGRDPRRADYSRQAAASWSHGNGSADLWKTSRTACSLAPMYLLRSSGPWGDQERGSPPPGCGQIWRLRNASTHLDADEVHPAFLGHSPGQQGLPCPRSSVEQQPGAVADWQFGEQDGILSKSRDGIPRGHTVVKIDII